MSLIIVLLGVPALLALFFVPYYLIIAKSEEKDAKNKEETVTPDHSALLQEIETLPADCIGEVEDFVTWIKHHKRSKTTETALLSEKALTKDLDTTEENKAWLSLEKAV
jgi:hypothetical protein